MKNMKLTIIAALALMTGLVGCNKENETATTDGKNFSITLSMAKPAGVSTRVDGGAALPTTTVGITNGYICFVSASGTITEVYQLIAGATDLQNKKIQASTLGTTPVVLQSVPGASNKVYLLGNLDSGATAPAVNGSIATYMTNTVGMATQSDYTKVTITGSGTINPKGGGAANEKVATITMGTNVSRLQLKGITFGGGITAATVAGIYLNGFISDLKLDGTYDAAKLYTSNTAADYLSGSTMFPAGLSTLAFDEGGFADMASSKVLPVNGVWGYNVFSKSVPQIVIKLTGIMSTDGAIAPDPMFVTISGFKTLGGAAITALEGGKIYTINATNFTITPGIITPEPGVTPVAVDVTVTEVEWTETEILPVM